MALIFVICNLFPASGQQHIKVARLHPVNLFFEEPIAKVINGDPLYFDVDIDGELELVTISINPTLEPVERSTGLTLISDTWNVYSYVLKLEKKPSKLNIKVKKLDTVLRAATYRGTISKDESSLEKVVPPKPYYNSGPLGNTMEGPGMDTDTDHPPKDDFYDDPSTRNEYFRKKIYYHKGERDTPYHIWGKNGKVHLFLTNLKYNKNELYFFFRLVNKESLDFEIGSLKTSIAPKIKKGNSYQKISMEYIYHYDIPARVTGGGKHEFVLVFEKFALDRKKALYIDIDELNGNRNIQLAIDGRRTINNPKRF